MTDSYGYGKEGPGFLEPLYDDKPTIQVEVVDDVDEEDDVDSRMIIIDGTNDDDKKFY